MRIFKIYIITLIIFACFWPVNIFSADQVQFPDVLRLQPMPPGIHPSNPGNINKSDLNSQNNASLLQEISQGVFDESDLNPNTSYIDTTNHLLFVVDTENNRIFIFELSPDNILVDYIPDYVLGQPDFTSSGSGTTQSTFNGPTGIAYNPDSRELFVADTNNNRIMVFDVSVINNGENAVSVLGQPDFTSSDSGTTQSSLDAPYSIDYDRSQNTLFVSDVNNNRIAAFDVSVINNGENAVSVLGQPDFTSSGSGTTQSTLNGPTAIAYNSDSHELFVADTNNNRIMVFDVSFISNGESAVNSFGQDESSKMSPSISERMQSAPENTVIPAAPKNNSFPFTTILIWFVIFAFIAIFIKSLFLHLEGIE